jgi:hypothetical protein
VGVLPGCSPPNPQNQNLEKRHFVDIMMSNVLRDLLFSQNQQLNSADDLHIRILKNKFRKLKKKQDRTL